MTLVQRHSFVGEVIPAGLANPQWLFVTKVDASGSVYGRRWSAKKRAWSKGETSVPYAREAVFKRTPRCPQPRCPQDRG